MTQLIVSLEDPSMIDDIKNAIKLLRGVVSVKTSKTSDVPNKETVDAIKQAENGEVIHCGSFDNYLEFVKHL